MATTQRNTIIWSDNDQKLRGLQLFLFNIPLIQNILNLFGIKIKMRANIEHWFYHDVISISCKLLLLLLRKNMSRYCQVVSDIPLSQGLLIVSALSLPLLRQHLLSWELFYQNYERLQGKADAFCFHDIGLDLRFRIRREVCPSVEQVVFKSTVLFFLAVLTLVIDAFKNWFENKITKYRFFSYLEILSLRKLPQPQ